MASHNPVGNCPAPLFRLGCVPNLTVNLPE
jgi:hypothetical protein